MSAARNRTDWVPGPWAVPMGTLPIDRALAEIAREAEHCSFCAAAFEPDERALVFLGQAMVRIKDLAQLAILAEQSA